MSDIENVKGVVFNIQHYSIHDGPGIRTTVFMNACPLRCLWCQNPESQTMQPQVFLLAEKCTGCGTCVPACPNHAISIIDGISVTDRKLCKGCGKCAEVCPNEARSLMGKEMTAGEVFKDINSDAIFYKRSGGGITLSGGDPVGQPEFSIAILKLCKQAGLHTAIETSGYAKWEIFKQILEHVDMVLFDFKQMDSGDHKKCTGVPNELILENAKKIVHELHIPLAARIPLIPGYNDDFDNIAATAKFIKNELDKSIKVHILPYHKLGETKYERMETPEKIVKVEPPSEAHQEEIRKMFEAMGLEAVIGG
jgi:pyruvate formate lyase activating enzyme